MLESVEWGEFKIGNLFKIGTGSLLSSSELTIGGTPRISAKSENNGVIGYFDTKNLTSARHFENFISVNFFGADGGIFYHPYKASVEMKVHTLKIPDVEFNARTGSFIAATLNIALSGFGYGSQLSSSKLKSLDFKIKLPVKNGQIDFDFMERFIAELEAERIAELEAYLTATGLKDYHLTPEEQQALEDFEAGKFVWGEFKFKEIFDQIKQGRRLKKDDQLPGEIPFVMSGVTDTGVVNHISNPVASFPKNSITVDIFGNTFYRNYDYGAGDDTGAYWSDSKEYTKEAMLFFTASINKALMNKFDYGNKLRSSQSLHLKMSLPSKNNQPDLSSMETLISAVQKLVIKDVVQYAEQKIAAHEQVVNNA